MASMVPVVVLLGVLALSAEAVTVTPVEKVIQMMTDMKAKGIEEKQAEEVTFTKFSTWCQNTDRQKEEAIAKGNAMIEKLKADIEKFNSDAKVLGQEIAQLDALNDEAAASKRSATEKREKEKADYKALHESYVNDIEQMGDALKTLKSMMKGGASLLQEGLTRVRIPSRARRIIDSFLATGSSTSEILAAPEAAAFESQSGGIVSMVTDLEDKMSDESTQADKEEMEADGNYQMMVQTLTDTIEQQTRSRTAKASSKKKKEVASAQASANLKETTATRDADEDYLGDLRATCTQKHADFEARQKLRQEEIEAIDKAIELIGSDDVSGSADKHLPGFMQAHTALAQLRTGEAEGTQRQSQTVAASFLKMQGHKLNSYILVALSARISSDPFKKVTKMIKDMIIKLTEDATEEAEHKGFCDTELSTNKQTRDSTTASVDELTAAIAQNNAQIQKLSTEVATLSDEIMQIDASVAKATSIRDEEHEKNTATVEDAKGAIVAVNKALTVLKEFYAKAAGATALVQAHGVSDDMPETFDKPFQGSGGEGGIIGMLEVILSDFERLEQETTDLEAEGKREYEQMMNDSNMDKAVKSQEVKNKESSKGRITSDMATNNEDLKSSQAELDAAMEYFEKLKPSCVDAGISYEDRVARREEEIQSLQEALNILTV